MKDIKIISLDELHTTIIKFINEKEIIIGEYEDMKECILTMIRSGYVFNMDRDRLRDAMEDLTYMLCPNDEINKDRVSKGLEYEYTDDEEDDEDLDYDTEEEEIIINKVETKDETAETAEKVEPEIEDIGNISGEKIDGGSE